MSQLEPGKEFSEPQTTTQSAYVMSLFRFCLKLNRLIDQIMFIDFILLSHPCDKSLGDAQSFNFTFFISYILQRKDCTQATRSEALPRGGGVLS